MGKVCSKKNVSTLKGQITPAIKLLTFLRFILINPINEKLSISSEQDSDDLSNKVTIEQLRAIWNDKKETYSDEELRRIQNWLSVISEAVINIIEKNPGKSLAEIIEAQPRKEKRKSRHTLIV